MNTTDDQQTGHLWAIVAIVQEWADAMPYPPSQRKLARRLGVSPTAVTDWKRGVSLPRQEHLRRLAAEVAVPYERVLDAELRDAGYR